MGLLASLWGMVCSVVRFFAPSFLGSVDAIGSEKRRSERMKSGEGSSFVSPDFEDQTIPSLRTAGSKTQTWAGVRPRNIPDTVQTAN